MSGRLTPISDYMYVPMHHRPTPPYTNQIIACYTAHVTKAGAAALRRQRAAREAELRGMGSLVAGSEHLVRVFFLDGSHRTVGFDRYARVCLQMWMRACVSVGGGGQFDAARPSTFDNHHPQTQTPTAPPPPPHSSSESSSLPPWNPPRCSKCQKTSTSPTSFSTSPQGS